MVTQSMLHTTKKKQNKSYNFQKIELCNCYEFVVKNILRTNNTIERWHQTFSTLLGTYMFYLNQAHTLSQYLSSIYKYFILSF